MLLERLVSISTYHIVMPAKAGIQDFTPAMLWGTKSWISAFAGMTVWNFGQFFQT